MRDASHEPLLILASTSRYRAELLSRLGIAFTQQAPDVTEAEIASELPGTRATRLAIEKARAVAGRNPGRWVLGSDQVASCDGAILHKPGTRDANIEQLLQLSGREAHFLTAVALIGEEFEQTAFDETVVRFRSLDRTQIQRYVEAEPSQDCAGGFKVEGLGITLFESVRSQDPTGLVGLPLIAVRCLLEQCGIRLP